MTNNGYAKEELGLIVEQGKINKYYPGKLDEYSTAKNFSTNKCCELIKTMIPSVVDTLKTVTLSQEFDSDKIQHYTELNKQNTTYKTIIVCISNVVVKLDFKKHSMAIFGISGISNGIAKAKLIKHVPFKSLEDLTKYLNSKYCTGPKIEQPRVDKYILEEICHFAIYPNGKISYYAQILHVIENGSIHRNGANRTYIIAGQFICLIDRNDLYITPVFRMNHFTEDGNVIKVTDINISEKNMSYSTLCNKFSKSQNFRESLIYFINGDQEKLFHYIHNPFHATALVAVLISEVIRNPIMIFNNRIAIQMNTLHTFSEFLQILPSLAGGTWKGQKAYGPKFLKKTETFLSNVEFSDLPLIDGDL
ncbi:uncharacterized protein LOC112241571 [Oncorhynchus tshawytscha]|uniref:uncharacterized protein LOC112241571 n=1 Tax=Oncorhynchus tshawytscha TaxID=74940 RepID=UPI001C3E619B|nr:uncharacterized protein LOC112241571 [Oncorhynchus tshawytscha]XP_042174659.1 uncharacterized protein LOC112241571 [Oncorhynchus tshawytscha]XP_042174660.1 uncharacterized protein LOC112241571 [Oncorhynchus tshawytscha]